MPPQPEQRTTHAGLWGALGAFGLWGLLPLYWKLVQQVPPFEILCHRIVWSAVFLLPLVLLGGRMAEVRAAVASRRNLLTIVGSSLLIGGNWFLYIWAVNSDMVLETSLGYYMTPLVNALLGALVLGERPSRVQLAAIAIAAAGVLSMLVSYGRLPWVALVLAVSFSFYGLLRKLVRVEPIPGLFLETMLLVPMAAGYLAWVAWQGGGGLGRQGLSTGLLLVGAGIATSTPLLCFAFAARRLRLTTLGVMQYIAPSLAFLLGAFVFREPVTSAHMLTFACIWTALALYTADGLRAARSAYRHAVR